MMPPLNFPDTCVLDNVRFHEYLHDEGDARKARRPWSKMGRCCTVDGWFRSRHYTEDYHVNICSFQKYPTVSPGITQLKAFHVDAQQFDSQQELLAL